MYNKISQPLFQLLNPAYFLIKTQIDFNKQIKINKKSFPIIKFSQIIEKNELKGPWEKRYPSFKITIIQRTPTQSKKIFQPTLGKNYDVASRVNKKIQLEKLNQRSCSFEKKKVFPTLFCLLSYSFFITQKYIQKNPESFLISRKRKCNTSRVKENFIFLLTSRYLKTEKKE